MIRSRPIRATSPPFWGAYSTGSSEKYKNGGEVARIGRDRIIFQYRPSIWAALTEYMPRDMVKRLDDVIRNERGGHFRRRPGA